jgi:CHAT domain-containing protein
MIYCRKKNLIVPLFVIGAAFMFFLGGSDFVVRARIDATAGQKITQTETEAVKLKNAWNEQSVRQSLEFYLKAAKDWETNKNFSDAARCLREAVRLKIMLAEENSAVELLEKSLRLEIKTGNLAGQAETYSLLTIVSTKSGDKKSSRFYHQRASAKAEQADQPNVLAAVYFSSALFFLNEQNFPEMKKQLEKALEIYRATGDKDGETETLTELAYGSIINNDRARGRDFAQAALEIAKSRNNVRNQTFALIALGDAHQRMGEWEQAIRIFNEAEKLFPENLDFYEKAILTNRIGFYHLTFGELNLAKKYFQKAFALFNRINKSEGSSELLSILGQISIEQKNYAEAVNYFDQSRAIAEKSNDALSLATLDLKIGESFFYAGNLPEAEKHFQSSLNYYNKTGLDYRIAEVQEKLGLVYEKQGNLKKAGEKYRLALGMNKKVLSKFAQAQNYYNLARLDDLQNQTASALENIKESIKLTESSRGETANNQLKRSFFSQVYDRYELYIALLMKMHKNFPNENYALQALQAAEQSRARVMLENLALADADFTKDADPETVKRENEIRALLNAKADKLTDLLSQNADKTQIEKLDAEINELNNELEEIKARLRRQSPIYSAVKNPAPFDVAEFQREVLDENSLLLEFSLGARESFLWLVGKREMNFYVLPPRAEIETHVEKLRESLAAREMKEGETIENYQARVAKAEDVYKSESAELGKKLFGQIAEKISDKRLIVVPDGKLHYFPVSALPLPDSQNGDPILLTNETIYEPSAQTLLMLSKNETASAPKNLLVFSDPIFAEDDSRLSAANESGNRETAAKESFRFVESLNALPRLTASKSEADSIANIVGASGSDVFSGFAANRDQLLNLRVADYKIIHFATHGLVNRERPELSGIVLSRFDEKGRKLNEFVRLHDIYGLNLNADLVVLSACDTGLGKEIKGEGLQSLNNAFLQVGAKTVMASLWKVEDGATLELMKNFYDAIKNKNATPSQALRWAQMKLRQNPQYQSPFYWAAFTVQGDFRSAPQISGGFGWRIYLLLIIPILLFGAYGASRFAARGRKANR